ncbi:MAG TPA: response regulator [Planctomycetota bacterium]|nr:response regulator [Planctomycetota bacterium]
MNILFVEDGLDVRSMQEALLSGLGHHVTGVSTGNAARHALAKSSFDLAVIDLRLPDMDGLELCRIIRADRRGGATVILVCTGRKEPEALDAAFRAGADDFLFKPFDPDAFINRVRVCERHWVLRSEREQIYQSLQQLKSNFENSDDAMIAKSLDGTIVAWNPAAEGLYGYSATEAIGKHLSMLVPPEGREDIASILAKLRTGQQIRNFETERIRKDGRRVYVSISVSPIRDSAGHVIGGSVVARDVSQRKMMENALAASERRLSRILESNLIPVLFWEMSGRITDANDVFLELIQYSRDDMRAGLLRWHDITPPGHEDADRKAVEQLQRTGRCEPFEKEYIRKDGTRVPVLLGAIAFEPARDSGVAFVIDLTTRKTLEEQLRQSQKMEAIGRLAGGIAHDFNNLLTVIIGRSDMLLARAEGRLKRDIQLIRETGDRASALTRQLLQFSRQQVLQPKIISLPKIVEDMAEMLRRLIGEHIELSVVSDHSAHNVKADPVQIQQVVLNLVLNARDAMPNGGKVTIEVADKELDAEYSRTHLDASPGTYVMLAVSDTGSGISPAAKARLFEPFFTTKERGKGTGLGLSTVYGIVKQSGGHIWVYSEPGHGTTFKVYIPATRSRLSKTGAHSTVGTQRVSGETILVVEDEQEIALLIKDVLTETGYQVLLAESGEAALRLSSAEPGEIHLLLTDVVMPQMSGKELSRKLLAQRPATKVIFMSGYTTNAIVHHGVLDETTEFIEKPFSPSTLIKRVREVLDSASQSRLG